MKNNDRSKMTVVIILGVALVIMLVFLGMICITQKAETLKYNNASKQESLEETEVAFKEPQEQEKSFEKFTLSTVSQQSDSEGTESETVDDEGEYLCEYSSTRYITEADIEELRAGNYGELPADKTILRMVVNEMYAKHGYEFTDQGIQDYFEKKEWYQSIVERNDDMNEIFENMSDIERANIDFLTQYDE